MLDGAHPYQAVEHGDAEEGNEANRGRDRERQPAEREGEDAAGRRHGNGQVDEQRQAHRVKRAVEQQEDQQHGHGNDDRQSFRGRLEMLELTTPAKEVAWRPRDLGLDRGPGLRHEPRDISIAHVDAHVDASLNVFTLDLAGSFFRW